MPDKGIFTYNLGIFKILLCMYLYHLSGHMVFRVNSQKFLCTQEYSCNVTSDRIFSKIYDSMSGDVCQKPSIIMKHCFSLADIWFYAVEVFTFGWKVIHSRTSMARTPLGP